MRVTQVPCANLRAHVPAAEGGRRELQTPDFQQHVGHGREGIPAQAQGCEPLQSGDIRAWDQPLQSLIRLATPPPPAPAPLCSRGVLQGHFKDQLGGQNKELWSLVWGLEQQGQHVEAAVSGGPAVLDAELGGEGRERGLKGLALQSPQGPPSSFVSVRSPPPATLTALPLDPSASSQSPHWLAFPSLPVPTSVDSTLVGPPISSPSAHLRDLHVGRSPFSSPCAHLCDLHICGSPLLLSPCPPPGSPCWPGPPSPLLVPTSMISSLAGCPLLLSPCPPPWSPHWRVPSFPLPMPSSVISTLAGPPFSSPRAHLRDLLIGWVPLLLSLCPPL